MRIEVHECRWTSTLVVVGHVHPLQPAGAHRPLQLAWFGPESTHPLGEAVEPALDGSEPRVEIAAQRGARNPQEAVK
jgi:hypothetical protein